MVVADWQEYAIARDKAGRSQPAADFVGRKIPLGESHLATSIIVRDFIALVPGSHLQRVTNSPHFDHPRKTPCPSRSLLLPSYTTGIKEECRG
ncbi:MAG: hypothetical protein NVS3B27_12310 [Novosphingobium sp.]